ncbi:hypothetical protein [Sphingomonas sp. Mn802worker]|uniref:hypothetical protein n=1 Tax=Sphingomonas sp. Mn802worker TaxID=629773 RepID=UPI0003A5A8D8|nr:hypothetical protein [Sphingomonas sp. Mn802worker]
MRKGRNAPAIIVASIGGTLVSMLAGMLLASYAVAGVTTSYPPRPAIHGTSIAKANEEPVQLTTIERIAADVDAAQASRQEL